MAICLDYQLVAYRKKDKSLLASHFFAGALLLSALCLKVWSQVVITDLGYEISRERTKSVELDMNKRELELQLSFIKRPDKISHEAKTRLGLGPVSGGHALRIRY